MKRKKTVVIELEQKRRKKNGTCKGGCSEVELGQKKKPPVSRTAPLCKAGLLESHVWDFTGEGRNLMQGKIVLQKNSCHWKTVPEEADLHMYQTQY